MLVMECLLGSDLFIAGRNINIEKNKVRNKFEKESASIFPKFGQ